MKVLRLKAVIRVKKVHRKQMRPDYAQDNKLKRQFDTQQAMEKLLTDITEFKLTNGQKVYLSAIYDLHTKKIIAHQMDTHCEQSLVNRTFKTITSKIIRDKTLIYSDRGSQYTSHVFNQYVKTNGLIHSMSRPGKCIDNGPMENVWGIIKSERFKLNTYQTVEDLKQDIQFFNEKRVTLNMGLSIPA
ncbi:IS3 family transposase [Oceanobacillus sp. FSL K6-3682]|uniref:IS3 family transposase n=1 Tax=Oceanobacillus sp. FSL K6-3682 TaxID=2921503 RepID=UPI0030DC4A04